MATRNLKDHAITASLNRLQELLDDKSLQDPKVVSDEAAQFNREKLLNVARSLRTLVNQSSATMVSESALNQMNSNLQQPISELTAFASNRNVGHLANAVSQIDQNVLNYMWAFFPRAAPSAKAEVAEVFDSIQAKSRETFGFLDEQKNELSQQVDHLVEQIKAQEARLNEAQEAAAKSKAEVAAALANLETIFNKDQTKRDTEYAEFLQHVKSEFSTAKNEFFTNAQQVLTALGMI